jgi:hypothetical protein
MRQVAPTARVSAELVAALSGETSDADPEHAATAKGKARKKEERTLSFMPMP